jgi:acetyl esterase/lipase
MSGSSTIDFFGPPTTRPPFDPEISAVYAAMPAGAVPYLLSDETLTGIRGLGPEALPGYRPPDLTGGGRATLEERTAPGPNGGPDITLTILRPSASTTPLPCLYHIHGGGMITGDGRQHLGTYVPYVAEGLAMMVSVHYRLAPENPDPAPVEDCYAGLAWIAAHAGELGVDPERLMVIGPSAGGGLAAGVALLARDRGYPSLTHQILICPMLDDRLETHSSRMLDGESIWDRNNNLYGWTALLGDRRGGPDVSIYAAPARATDLTGLPRTYLDTGSAEVFRDEILIYAQRLSAAGVSVDLHMWGGCTHGFDNVAPHAKVSLASIATRDEFIRRALE